MVTLTNGEAREHGKVGIEDALLVAGSVGHVETRAVASGTFWHEAELNASGKELYEELSE